MLKKIEIWILYLVLHLSILFRIGFGVLERQELVRTIKAGWVSITVLFFVELPMNYKMILKHNLKVEDRLSSLYGFNGTPNSEEPYFIQYA